MIILPLFCTCSALKVNPKNWQSAKVSIKKDWYVYYRFYDPVFKENPTYKEVCSHTTGHVEALEVTFDPSQTTYEELAKLFFEIHDPTQANGQGNDVGPQYLSEIFYVDDAQKATAEKLIGLLQLKGLKVATQLKKATKFWPAEDYHQQYYEKEGGTPYCHRRVTRF